MVSRPLGMGGGPTDPRLHPVSFHGRSLKSCQTPEFTPTENVYGPNLEVPWHLHEHPYIGITLRGTFVEHYGTRTRRCTPGTVTFHPAGEVHSNRFDKSGAQVLNVEISRPSLESLSRCCATAQTSIDFTGGKPSWLATRLYEEFLQMDELSPMAIAGLVLELVSEILRKDAGPQRARRPSWLDRARELVHARFTERLTLAEIAGSVGVHPVHLAREFRRHYGLTVGEFIRELWVEYACREIFHQGRTLADIAVAAGFSDQSNFCRTFRKLTGMTPHQFRGIASRN